MLIAAIIFGGYLGNSTSWDKKAGCAGIVEAMCMGNRSIATVHNEAGSESSFRMLGFEIALREREVTSSRRPTVPLKSLDIISSQREHLLLETLWQASLASVLLQLISLRYVNYHVEIVT